MNNETKHKLEVLIEELYTEIRTVSEGGFSLKEQKKIRDDIESNFIKRTLKKYPDVTHEELNKLIDSVFIVVKTTLDENRRKNYNTSGTINNGMQNNSDRKSLDEK